MASVLPSNLSFFMSRMQGVSTSHFKINPQTSGDVGPNRILRFEVPSNVIVNFRSLRMFMNCECSNSSTKATSLPNDISSLIERVSVYVGGVLVANGFNGYNTFVHAKAALQGYKCGALGHPEMVRQKCYHSFLGSSNANAVLGNTATETYASDAAGNDYFCIDNFEGLLGSIEPSLLDTGLVGTIVIEISLADNTVCSVSDSRALPALQTDVYQVLGTAGFDILTALSGGTPTYTLKNINMQVEVLSLATNVLDTIVEQRIGQIGYLSLPFKNIFSFSNTHDSSTRFNVNSASWDRVWFAFRDTGFANVTAPVRVKGYKCAGAFTAATSGGAVTGVDVGVPEYDAGGTLNTNAEKYKPFYFNFREPKTALGTFATPTTSTPTVATTYQLQINSASVPNYRLTAPELYAMSMNSLDYYDKNHKITLHQYKCNYFVGCMRLCLPDSDYSRLGSGVDCRGVSSSCSINTTGLVQSNLTIFCECTSELRIGAGRQIEVIV